jgi:hypothetical protein
LYSEPEEIAEMISEMENESRAIHEQILDVCVYMRGALTYDQAWNLSFKELKLIQKNIKGRIEVLKKSQVNIL